MKHSNRIARIALAASLLAATGCTTSRSQASTDLTAGLEVATAIEGVYAAQPKSDPKTVAEVSRLLLSAQAAVTAFAASTSPVDQAAASAAVAALVAYEASAPITP
jgi:predicted RecA/RadA family phage recombinase